MQTGASAFDQVISATCFRVCNFLTGTDRTDLAHSAILPCAFYAVPGTDVACTGAETRQFQQDTRCRSALYQGIALPITFCDARN
eukprot:3096921-Rhodomonas_salina.1